MQVESQDCSENDETIRSEEETVGGNHEKVSSEERLMHFTWAWYVVPMSTGGFASLLGVQPFQFKGLRTIGKIVFIWNLVLCLIITILLSQRFLRCKGLFMRSIKNPGESLFIPTSLLTIATIIMCTQIYGVPSTGVWLTTVLQIVFWIYTFMAFTLSIVQYLHLFTAKRLLMENMLPTWFLPVFPSMLVGTIAGPICQTQTPTSAMNILVAGLAFQGLGFWAATPLYGVFMTRLLQFGLPLPNMRPGMFVAAGPPSFTALALITMSNSIPKNHPYFQANPIATDILRQISLAFAIFLWVFAFWFFVIAFCGILLGIKKMSFHLSWYAAIFPNVGLMIATIRIGESLQSSAIKYLGSAGTIYLALLFIFITFMHIRAIWLGQILWPGHDEDKET